MALIKCPECGRMISTWAEFCPGCGIPQNIIKKILTETTNIDSVDNENSSDFVDDMLITGIDNNQKYDLICLVCHHSYQAAIVDRCPKCNYPAFSLVSDIEQIRRYIKIYRKKNGILQKTTYKEGDQYTMGHYADEPIQWRVLATDNDKALLISDKGLDAKFYHSEHKNITWAECDLEKWLNQSFYDNAFEENERQRIVSKRIRNDDNPTYLTRGGADTNNRIFLLSIKEVKKYFKNDDDRRCYPTDYARKQGAYTGIIRNGSSWWWLRSPGDDSKSAASVNADGSVNEGGNYAYNGKGVVRPALWINL